MEVLLIFCALAWLVLAKAVYDGIREQDKASPGWRIAFFASIGPPIIIWGMMLRMLRIAR